MFIHLYEFITITYVHKAPFLTADKNALELITAFTIAKYANATLTESKIHHGKMTSRGWNSDQDKRDELVCGILV